MKKAIEMKKFFLGTLAIGGAAVGFTLGLNRGQETAYTEARSKFEPLIKASEEEYKFLTQQEHKRKGITSSDQSWMPLRFRFAGLDEILAEASASEAPRAMLSRIQSLPKEEIEATLRDLHKTERDENDFVANFAEYALLLRFAEIDSEAALAFANTTSPSRRDATRAAVLAVLAETDASNAAIAALDEAGLNTKNLFTRRRATDAVAKTWARQDPQAAVEWATNLPDPYLQTGAAADAIYEAPHDQWGNLVTSINDPFVHDYVAGDLAYRWSLSEPQAAVDWAYSLPVESHSSYQSDPVVHAMRGWWRSYPNRAAAYLGQLPRNSRRNRDICRQAVPELFQEWLINDPAAALAYVSTMPDCPFRDEALMHIERALIIVIDLDKLQLPKDATFADTVQALANKFSTNSDYSDFMGAGVSTLGNTEWLSDAQSLGDTAEIISAAQEWVGQARESGLLSEADFQALEEQAAAEQQAAEVAAQAQAEAAARAAEAESK